MTAVQLYAGAAVIENKMASVCGKIFFLDFYVVFCFLQGGFQKLNY